ncbi:hypothetical protein [Polaromonas sp. CG9_12]|uniref:general secretion pathway protein GspB n=1 Tax=Polaromonas sp. CG_9.11 TaxID=2787730 RepID=UPI0004DDD72F|nr:general secretion pathway protein GspB [Polaromonas sp. CG_9.11]MBG6075434.1 general secretion pathway protein B [Polaromonas sp. CG_9.11]CDS54271.1 hypothetical protein [Polaromonas sp. CG9_12]
MSYILDALKRAERERERERGAVPSLQSRHVATPSIPAGLGARHRLGLAAAAVLALGGIAAGAWVWQTPAGGVRLAAVEPPVAMPTVPAAPAQPVPTPAPAPVSPRPAPPSARPPAGAAPRAAATAPPAVVAAAPRPVSKPAPPAPAVSTQTPPRPSPAPAPAPAVAKVPGPQDAPVAIPLLSALSEDIRRQIPALAITGSVYSKNPGQRLLLVNNQVLPQGSLAAPEVTLVEIQVKSSVFSFRGTRFRVVH